MAIHINEAKKLFGVTTNNTSYVFGVDEAGLLRHLYWGAAVSDIEEFEMPVIQEVSTNDPVYEVTPEEYPVYGSLRYKEHCLKATFEDLTREVVYRYAGYTVDGDELIIHLEDGCYQLQIDLHYKAYADLDLMERWVTLKNGSDKVIKIEKLYSAQLHIPYENLRLTNTHGHWGAEQQQFRQPVGYGKIYLENRRGISTHHHNPYFMLDRNATETSGEVYFGALKLTGNFSGIIEQTQYGETLVQFGINPHDWALHLKGGESFTAPRLLFGYSNQGFEKVSHLLHHYAEERVLRKGLRPVLYNSWEATEFKVQCDEQIKLARLAHEIGAELFVVDDGWFGERNGIHNGLGDWYVNREKFPNGLKPLIDEVKGMGMLFGIWVEPEMVNPLSKLYKDHPDWIYQFKTRESDTSRGQYVLDMTKPEVKNFVYEMLDDLLSTHQIDYIKWDANRPMSQTSLDQSVWHKHIEAVYAIVKELKEKHPHVLFEACASGGGRIDYGILGIFDDFWTSDNTDAYDRLHIQNTYSYMYPIKAMRAWVTDCPNFLSKREIPLRFRYHSAMMGTLGIGGNILKWEVSDLSLSKELIAQYKDIRHIVQEGQFYRLENTSQNAYHCFEYVKGDEALVFVFLPQTQIGHRGARIKLRGLEANKKYEFTYEGKTVVKSGAYLMHHGLDIRLVGDYASEIIKLMAVEK